VTAKRCIAVICSIPTDRRNPNIQRLCGVAAEDRSALAFFKLTAAFDKADRVDLTDTSRIGVWQWSQPPNDARYLPRSTGLSPRAGENPVAARPRASTRAFVTGDPQV
jgi:hypothetical protein